MNSNDSKNQKIVISCDTTVALPRDEVKSLGIEMIPLNAIADGVEYHDTVDIDSEKLCVLMKQGAKISTSTPTIVEIENYFDEIFERTKADVIIHFPISSKLSSMYSLFTRVCEEKYKDKVIVFDTLSICIWQANQVKYAKRLVDEGLNSAEIIDKIKQNLFDTESAVFVPETLEYLKRGGRISAATATLANFIGVIPVLTFSQGEVGKKGVTRTLRKAFTKQLEEWEEMVPNFRTNFYLAILYTDCSMLNKVEKTKMEILEELPEMEVTTGHLSLNVTAHTGPGTMGIALVKKI